MFKFTQSEWRGIKYKLAQIVPKVVYTQWKKKLLFQGIWEKGKIETMFLIKNFW